MGVAGLKKEKASKRAEACKVNPAHNSRPALELCVRTLVLWSRTTWRRLVEMCARAEARPLFAVTGAETRSGESAHHGH